MSYKDFFDKHGNDVLYTTTFHAGQTTRLEAIGRVEYVYSMFKARMMDELRQDGMKPALDYHGGDNAISDA